MISRRLKPAFVEPETPTAPTRGFVVGWEPERGISVELADSGEIVTAQSMVALAASELDRAARERTPALVVFEDGDRARPVVMGLLAAIPARTTGDPAAPAQRAQDDRTEIADDVVLVRGRDSIELRCGEASITLHKDGKVMIRGTYVLSRASKENRLAGGSIHLN
jgi:hypothetical protein